MPKRRILAGGRHDAEDRKQKQKARSEEGRVVKVRVKVGLRFAG
jgi:hypothetical protein